MRSSNASARKLKLAVFTDEISQDFERAVRVAQEYRLDGIEVRSVWGNGPHKIPEKDILRMRQVLSGTPLRVCSIAAPFFKCDIASDNEYREHLDILKRCIDLGKRFDCSLVRGFTFWRKGAAKDVWSQILARFDAPLRLLEHTRSILGIENESSTFIGTGQTLRKFLDEIRSPQVKAVWDPANSLADTGEFEVPFPDGYNALKEDIVHVHVKDGKRVAAGIEHTPVGEGQIGWAGQFKALADDGFAGYCSLETHWRPAKMDREMIDRPGGEAFSGPGEYASRKCLDNILKLVQAL